MLLVALFALDIALSVGDLLGGRLGRRIHILRYIGRAFRIVASGQKPGREQRRST